MGIAAFWFLVGLSIERRRNKQALGQHHPILAGVLFTVAALVCGLAGIGVGRNPNNLMWTVVRFDLSMSEMAMLRHLRKDLCMQLPPALLHLSREQPSGCPRSNCIPSVPKGSDSRKGVHS